MSWTRISNFGVYAAFSHQEKSKIRITNQMVIIVAALSVLYFVVDWILGTSQRTPAQYNTYLLITFASILLAPVVLLLHYLGRHLTARILMLLILTFIVFINSLQLSEPFHSELYFFPLVYFAFAVFNNQKFIIPVFILQVVLFCVVVYNIIESGGAATPINFSLYFRIVIAFLMVFLGIYFLKSEARSYQDALELKNIELSAEHEEIRKINYTKDRIFSIISHDLRSPIGSLEAVLGLLKSDQLNEQEFRRATTGLEKQVQQLRLSLDEILTWSKSQLHGINPEPHHLDVRALIIEVVTIHRLAARNKRIIITTNVSPGLKAYCDENMLRSVITNMITNAIKFTPVGGAISIQAESVNGKAVIVVEDTGVGISKENLEKMLSPTIHFTTRGTNNEKGTGLGVTMSRDFILKNQGSFEVHSEDGKGTRFVITLPQ